MTAAMRLCVLAGTIGSMLAIVLLGSLSASQDEATDEVVAPSTTTRVVAAAPRMGTSTQGVRSASSGHPDIVMGSPLPASMNPPRLTPLPERRHGELIQAEGSTKRRTVLLNRWTVGQGETLSEIAQKALGSSSRWRDIVAINPGIDPDRLKVGSLLKLPPRDAAVSVGQTPATRPAATATTHVVKAGETLSSIAQRYLGSGNDWRRVFNANSKSLHGDPNRLVIGMTLVIPAR